VARVFISHSSKDNAKAVGFQQWLASKGWDDVFLDLDPERGLKAGERWQEALKRASARCELVIFLITPDWAASRWCQAEFLLAKSLNKRIFGAVIETTPSEELPIEMTADWQLVDLVEGAVGYETTVQVPPGDNDARVAFSRDGLDRLELGLREAGLDARYFAWPPEDDPERPPYRGLRPLEAKDAGIFFGRDGPVIDVLDRLRGVRDAAPPRMMVILGASGAGKSSFMRAGLLPRLARDRRHFLPLPVVRPERAVLTGDDGFLACLEAALRTAGQRPVRAELRSAIESGGDAIADILARHALSAAIDGDAPTLVLPIDQGEELFLAEGVEESKRFLELVHDLLNRNSPSLMLLLTIRSDSYEPLQTAGALDGVTQQTWSLPPMPRGAYGQVIEGPARRQGQTDRPLVIEEALTEALLADIDSGGAKDALPLLAFTLERLYVDYGGDGDLKLTEYEALGRIGGAIEAAVEQALKVADRDPRIPVDRAARLILLRRGLIPWLAGIDPDSGSPRRRVARISEIPDESRPLIDLLVEQRLLATDVSPETGETTIEPAHEALLRQWGTLEGWLEEDFEDLSTAEGVRRAARDWEANDRHPEWLAHAGGRLEAADHAANRPDFKRSFTAGDRDYLEAARESERQRRAARERRRESELQAATDRVEAARRIARRTAAGLIVSLVLAIVAAGVGYLALQESSRADRAAADAIKKAAVAVAAQEREAAARSDAERQRQLADSSAKQAEARRIEAESGRLAAETAESEAELQRQRAEQAALEAETQRKAAEASARLAEAARADAEAERARALEGQSIFLSQQARRELQKGNERAALHLALEALPNNPSGDSRPLVPEAVAILARAVDSRRLRTEFIGHGNSVLSLAFSPDGQTLATTSSDRTVRLWDIATGRERFRIDGHVDAVMQAAFEPTGRFIVTLGANHARVWDIAAGRQVAELRGHKRPIQSVAFSADGRYVATGAWDHTVRIWRASDWRLHRVIRGPKFDSESVNSNDFLYTTMRQSFMTFGGMEHLAFSPDGRRIATAGYLDADAAARVWNVESGEQELVLSGHAQAIGFQFSTVSFSPDGAQILTAGADGTARLWSAHDGSELAVLKGQGATVSDAVFSPDGNRVVTASQDGTIQLWSADGSIIAAIEGHSEAVVRVAFSPDGALIATASHDRTARLWDGHTGEPIANLVGHAEWVLDVGFSVDGRHLATASRDSTARLWRTRTDTPVAVLEAVVDQASPFSIGREWSKVKATTGPAGAKVAVSWPDANQTVLVDALSGQRSAMLDGAGFVFAPFGSRGLVWRDFYDQAQWPANLVDSGDGRVVQRLVGSDPIFSPDGEWVATVDGIEAILASAKTGEDLARLTSDQGALAEVFFTVNEDRLIGRTEGGVLVWRLPDGALIDRIDEPDVIGVIATRDGDGILTLAEDGQSTLWRLVGERRRLERLFVDTSPLARAAFSPDGRRLVLLSANDIAELRDVATGELIGRYLPVRTPNGFDKGWGPLASLSAPQPNLSFAKTDGFTLGDNDEPEAAMTESSPFSVNSRWLLTTVGQLIDSKTGQIVATDLAPPNLDAAMIAVSEDGETALVCSGDQIKLLALQTSVVLGSHEMQGESPEACFFDGTAAVIRLNGNRELEYLPQDNRLRARDGPLQQTTLAKQTREGVELAIVVSDDGQPFLVRDGKWHPLTVGSSRPRAVSKAWFSLDAGLAVLASQVGEVEIWHTTPARLRGRFSSSAPVEDVLVIRDNEQIVLRSTDGGISVWSVNGDMLTQLSAKGMRFVGMAIAEVPARIVGAMAPVNQEFGFVASWLSVWDLEGNQIGPNLQGKPELASEQFGSGSAKYAGRHILLEPPAGPVLLVDIEDGSVSRRLNLPVPLDRKNLNWTRRSVNLVESQRVLLFEPPNAPLLLDAISGETIATLGTKYVTEADVTFVGGPIITIGGDGLASLWDQVSGRLIAELRHDDTKVRAAQADVDSGQIYTIAADGSVMIWSAIDGRSIARLPSHPVAVDFVKGQADGRLAATVDGDGTTRIWDLSTSRKLLEIAGTPSSGKAADIQPPVIMSSPHGRHALIRENSFGLRYTLVDIEQGVVRARFDRDDPLRLPVFVSSTKFASFAADGSVLLRDVSDGALVAEMLGPVPAGFQDVDLELDGSSDRIIVAADGSQLIIIRQEAATLFDGETGAFIADLGQASVKSAGFSQDGAAAYTAFADGTVQFWRTEDAMLTTKIDSPERSDSLKVEYLSGETDGPVLSVGPDHVHLNYVGKIGSASVRDGKLWQIGSGTQVAGEERILAVSDDGRVTIAQSAEFETEAAIIARLDDGARQHILVGYAASLSDGLLGSEDKSAFVLRLNRPRIARIEQDFTIRITDFETGGLEPVLAGHTNAVTALIEVPGGELIATGSRDRTVRLWDGLTGAEIGRLGPHQAPVKHLSVSDNGERLAGYYIDGTIRIWSLPDGVEMVTRTDVGDVGQLFELAPDGKWLLTGTGDYGVRLFDVAIGEEPVRLTGTYESFGGFMEAPPVDAIAYPTDGQSLALPIGKRVVIWDLKSGKRIFELPAGRQDALDFALIDIAPVPLPNDSWLVKSPDGTAMEVWSATTGRRHAVFPLPEGDDRRVEVAADAGTLFLGLPGGSGAIWDTVSGDQISAFDLPTAVGPVRLSPNGERLLITMRDGGAGVLLDTATGQRLADLPFSGTWGALAFLPGDRRVLAIPPERSPMIIDLDSGAVVADWTGADGVDGQEVARVEAVSTAGGMRIFLGDKFGFDERIVDLDGRLIAKIEMIRDERYSNFSFYDGGRMPVSAAFAPGDGLAALGLEDGNVVLVDIESGRLVAEFTGHSKAIRKLAFDATGQYLVTLGDDGVLRLWDTVARLPVGHLNSGDRKVFDFGISDQDMKIMALVGDWGISDQPSSIIIWAPNHRSITELPDSPGAISDAGFSPGGAHVAAVALNGRLALWDTATGALLMSGRNHDEAATSVAFGPVGRLLVSTGRDGVARIWDGAKLQRKIVVPSAAFTTAVVSADARRLVLGAEDGVVTVWDIASGEQLRAFSGRGAPVETAVFLDDGQTVAVADRNSVVQLLHTAPLDLPMLQNTANLIAYARALADAPLTDAERKSFYLGARQPSSNGDRNMKAEQRKFERARALQLGLPLSVSGDQ
jgi:WD40 repeat protein